MEFVLSAECCAIPFIRQFTSLFDCSSQVLGSYVDLAGAQGLWVIYADMTSNFLWLECALIELGSEIYHLRHHAAANNTRKRIASNNEDYTIIHDH